MRKPTLTESDISLISELLEDGVRPWQIALYVYGISVNALRLRMRVFKKNNSTDSECEKWVGSMMTVHDFTSSPLSFEERVQAHISYMTAKEPCGSPKQKQNTMAIHS